MHLHICLLTISYNFCSENQAHSWSSEADSNFFPSGDDDFVEWYDLYLMGENDERFEFPVPMEPPVPVEELNVVKFENGVSAHSFYCDSDGYAPSRRTPQVSTQGEGKNLIDWTTKASVGVWFGSDHTL